MPCRLKFILALAIFCAASAQDAWSFASIYCGRQLDRTYACVAAVQRNTAQDAMRDAAFACQAKRWTDCTPGYASGFSNVCVSLAAPPDRTNWAMATGSTADEASGAAQFYCSSHRGGVGCTTLITTCEPPPASATAADEAADATDSRPMSDADWANLASFLVFVNRLTWSIAIAIDVVLVLVLFKTAGSHRRRLITFGGLTATCGVLSVVLPLVIPSLRSSFTFPYFNFALDVFDRAAESAIVISGIPFIVLLISNVEHHSRPLPLRQKNSGGLDVPAQHIEVLIARSQRMNWLNRVIFVIDARMGVGAEQLDLISKYRLGKTIVFDSARRERQNELARTHLESARERNTRTICLWREEVRGFFRRIWLLIRALISFLLGFLFIRITLAKLIRGTHVESKSLDTILAAKNAIERGAGDLKAYLEVAETFDGREDLFEPS